MSRILVEISAKCQRWCTSIFFRGSPRSPSGNQWLAGGMSGLVGSFLDDASTCIEELRRGTEAADADLVATACHRLQGSSAGMGASPMAEICAELEAAAVGGALGGASALLRRLEAEFVRVQPELVAAFPEGKL